MEIREMTMNDIETRSSEIAEELEKGGDVETLEAEVRALEERKAEILKEAEERKKMLEEVERTSVETVKITEKENNMEIRNSKQYIDAFANYVKTGKDVECRALLTENGSGTLPVPEFVEEIVAERLKESKILSRVRRTFSRGNVKVGFEYDAPAAAGHAEGDGAVEAEDLKLGIVELIPTTWKKWLPISDEALDTMSGENFLRYIYDEITRGIIKAREKAVVDAILNAPQVADASHPAVAKTGAAPAAITDFVNARALLSDAAEDLVIICSPAHYAMYKGLQLSGTYGADPFDGLEVITNVNATAPIIGDLYGVLENMVNGNDVQFKYDDKTDMKSDLVNILGRLPSAIGVVGNLYFAKVAA